MWYLDLVSTIFSLVSTYCFIKADIRMWPLAIIATLLNTCLYYYVGMYATMTLECSYLTLSIYGWIYWYKKSSSQKPIEALNQRYLLAIIIFVLILFGVLLVCHITQLASLMLWDITAVSISLMAQWLTCRKIITCWHLWFIADSIYIGLMFSQNLYFHTCLFSIYLVMAILGYCNWLKLYQQQDTQEHEDIGSCSTKTKTLPSCQ